MKVLLAVTLMAGAFLLLEVRAEGRQVALPATETIDIADIGPAVSVGCMREQTGRQGIQIDEMNNIMNSTESSATVGGNLLTSMSTGTNNVSGSAFSTASGVATIIQNSGNQNVIQNSFILNLSVK